MYRPVNHGYIETVIGPMYSGKSEELIRRLKRAKIAKISMDIERQVTHIQELEKERRMARTDLKNEILYKQIDFCIQKCQDEESKKQLQKAFDTVVKALEGITTKVDRNIEVIKGYKSAFMARLQN